jgi:hypothetical protein
LVQSSGCGDVSERRTDAVERSSGAVGLALHPPATAAAAQQIVRRERRIELSLQGERLVCKKE